VIAAVAAVCFLETVTSAPTSSISRKTSHRSIDR